MKKTPPPKPKALAPRIRKGVVYLDFKKDKQVVTFQIPVDQSSPLDQAAIFDEAARQLRLKFGV